MTNIKYIELNDLYDDNDSSSDEDDFDDSDYKSDKMVTILEHNNIAYGMELNNWELILGQDLEPHEVKFFNKVTLRNGRTHTLYNLETDDDCKINYINFSPMLFIGIKYKDICFWNRTLIDEIKKLLKYSYCLVDDYEYFYFPIIKLVLWTNKNVKKVGYSYAIVARNFCSI